MACRRDCATLRALFDSGEGVLRLREQREAAIAINSLLICSSVRSARLSFACWRIVLDSGSNVRAPDCPTVEGRSAGAS